MRVSAAPKSAQSRLLAQRPNSEAHSLPKVLPWLPPPAFYTALCRFAPAPTHGLPWAVLRGGQTLASVSWCLTTWLPTRAPSSPSSDMILGALHTFPQSTD